MLIVDWAPNEREGDKLLFVFDGGTLDDALTDSIRLPVDELERWDYVDAQRLDSHLPPRLVLRVTAALDARQQGTPSYAEHGRRLQTSDADPIVRPVPHHA